MDEEYKYFTLDCLTKGDVLKKMWHEMVDNFRLLNLKTVSCDGKKY